MTTYRVIERVPISMTRSDGPIRLPHLYRPESIDCPLVDEHSLVRTFRPAIAVAVLLAACFGTGTEISPESEVLISAAASLTGAFAEIEGAFEAANPDIEVLLNLGPSSSLREQILEGAPADVFASANMANMDQLVAAGEVSGDPQVFAVNRLEIAVPAGNPAGITGLSDFDNEELVVGLCAEAVPCGDFARQALSRAGVTPMIDSNEPDVRALLTKIESGELDAGITYVTDVASSGGRVDGIEIPERHNIRAEYPVATIAGAPNPHAAAAFVAFLLSAEGQAVLGKYGFESP